MVTLKVKDRTNRWTTFYPIDTSNGIMEEKVIYESIASIPDQVYGKYVHFFAGYQPVWMYKTLPKSAIKINE